MRAGAQVTIGGASAFLGDSSVAVPQLLRAAPDYLVLDYLAETTMAILARAVAKRPDAGYARYFTDVMWQENVAALAERGVKLVTNAGGMNPHACRERMAEIADAAGVSLRIAVVDGDDLRGRLDELAGRGITAVDTGAAFPDPASVRSANAYLGARPIAEALAAGADVVVTGRVVDSALTLGPLVHEFGWSWQDYDLLAAGTLAGHVIECGAQATGGLFTDWEQVPDWAHIGYPIAECAADGSFVVTKPEGTGGLVTPATVAEQILYEINDPQAYLVPDVACDLSEVTVEQAGEHRVAVRGARGRPPPATLKVCATSEDGQRVIAALPLVGIDAPRKAERQAAALLERLGELLTAHGLPPYRAERVEIVGAEATYGKHARAQPREVICKIGLEHDDPRALDLFLREVHAPTTSMAVGTTGWYGAQPAQAPVIRLFSFTLPRAEITAQVHLDGEVWAVPETAHESFFDATTLPRPTPAPPPAGDEPMAVVPLVELAYARSGDKGDGFNVGVIARDPALLPAIRAALSPEAVQEFFSHEFEGARSPSVERYDLPGLAALNLVCAEALGGGQMASLRLDPLAKGKAQQLLELEIPVPVRLLGLDGPG